MGTQPAAFTDATYMPEVEFVLKLLAESWRPLKDFFFVLSGVHSLSSSP